MDKLSLFPTEDGSVTFWSDTFQETFHSSHGAKHEAEAKFVIPAKIAEKARIQTQLNILDVCYGLGYNSAAAIACVSELPDRSANLHIIALENNLEVPQKAIAAGLVSIWQPAITQILKTAAETQSVVTENLSLQLLIGDARQTISQVPTQWADAIFLDPFSPLHCPQLWTVEFIQLLVNCLKPDGYLVTYSSSAAVRTAMLLAGLEIGAITPVGRKSPSTIAAFSPIPLPPISDTEAAFLKTRAAIPYRDRTLQSTAAEIIASRQAEQKNSKLPPSSSLRKKV
ncbi:MULTISPECIES: tRNA (5-methylaminomethyl-2-thiouridine)(34)-methyltransferase MnmD [Pseudanabaena]|uniref:tRNA (5-methylaminomethyl-2-thiouridine)(34)-methyltransferase MnmD n=1 Tax=Pseudanabaena TaxID=1152 RepID=UPI00247AC780|nr:MULTISPECIES: MnmC family methyltransferase [Pseudanabaena]MEA5490135.1 MnmC family methyltransferase [Pseudanabaena sp. CCNP1317]WGS72398.1 MnmC family methyltransferase [Pseudanabaena galeata CCNP1313]